MHEPVSPRSPGGAQEPGSGHPTASGPASGHAHALHAHALNDPSVIALFNALGGLLGEVREAARRDIRLAQALVHLGRTIEGLGQQGGHLYVPPTGTPGVDPRTGLLASLIGEGAARAAAPIADPEGSGGSASGFSMGSLTQGPLHAPTQSPLPTPPQQVRPAPPQVRGPRLVGYAPEPPPPIERAPLRLGGMSMEVPVRDSLDEVERLRAAEISSGRAGAERAGGLTTRPPGAAEAALRGGAFESGEEGGWAGERGQEAEPLPDLDLIARRCRIKAECCRWAIERRHLLEDETVVFDVRVKPRDEELLARVRETPNCYAWTLNPYAELPDIDESIEIMANAFDNLALMAEVMSELMEYDEQDRDDYIKRAYMLFAEAQSAVRRALRDAGEKKTDQDQDETFRWLRIRTKSDQVYVSRYMTLQDPADPAIWADTRARIVELRDEMKSQRDFRRQRRNLLNKIRYIIGRLHEYSGEEVLRQWRTLGDTVEQLLQGGVKPSDRELRERLIPVIDEVPEAFEPTRGMEEVLRSIDQYVASQEAAAAQTAHVEARSQAEEVKKAAELTRGRVMILIGGERRREAEERLIRDLELRDLRWLSAPAHSSVSQFEPSIARPEVDLVVLAIRWASHSFEETKYMCERYGKPFVRLPAGYSPNRVARDILEQVSDQLRSRPRPNGTATSGPNGAANGGG